MSDAAAAKRVRHFRQILLWPLQLMPLKEGNQVQRHWEVLHSAGADNPWREVDRRIRRRDRDTTRNATTTSWSRSCRTSNGSSMATATRSRDGHGNSPMRVFRRDDIGAVRVVAHPGCRAGDTEHRARRPVLLLRHRRDAAERRGLRKRPVARRRARHPVPLRPRLSGGMGRKRPGNSLDVSGGVARA